MSNQDLDPFSDSYAIKNDNQEDSVQNSESDHSESDGDDSDEYDETMFQKFMQGPHTPMSGGSQQYDDGDDLAGVLRVTLGAAQAPFMHQANRNASLAVSNNFMPGALRKAQKISNTIPPLSHKLTTYTPTHGPSLIPAGPLPPIGAGGMTTTVRLSSTAIQGSSGGSIQNLHQTESINSITGVTSPLARNTTTRSKYITHNQIPQGVAGGYSRRDSEQFMLQQQRIRMNSALSHSLSQPQVNYGIQDEAGDIPMYGDAEISGIEGSMTSLGMVLMHNRKSFDSSIKSSNVLDPPPYDAEDTDPLIHVGQVPLALTRTAAMGGPLQEIEKVGMVLSRADTNKRSLLKTFRQKEIYLQLSVIFGIFLLGVVVYDFCCLLVWEFAPVTVKWLISLLFLHVSAIYLFVLSFIYANESRNYPQIKFCLLAGGINFLAFILRVVLQLQFGGYEPAGMEDL
ncbi:UNVERIFIED_CONTAM: hypothetical protein HDU68_006691 [Siphonaria sp. JEL0065]|nr:hypothetical protein HDU68_006691 [Siphonaria sp. JEL0065]